MRTVKKFSSRYRWRRSSDHTIVRHSRCVVSYFCSVLLSNRDQSTIDFGVFFGWLYSRTQSTWTLPASVSMISVRGLPVYGSADTGGVMSVALRLSIALSSLLFSGRKVAGQSFFMRRFSGSAVCASLRTNR